MQMDALFSGNGMKNNAKPVTVEWLRSVMDRHEGPLLRYAARIVGEVDRGRDVVQDAFLRLWAKRPTDWDDSHVAQWLFTVCRNLALDICRKERRMSLLGEQQIGDAGEAAESPPAAAERREQVGQVAEALAELPTNQQEVLRLKFQNGFSYKQIAGITGLSVSNVGFLIHTGIGKLRDRFAADGLIARA